MNQQNNTTHDEFMNDPTYRRNEKQLRDQYIVQLQLAKFQKGGKQYGESLIMAGETLQKKKIIYICGRKQPDKDEMGKFIAQIAMQIESSLQQGFILVYINSDLLTHQNLSRFYSAYSQLPVEYFQYLDAIYILHGNMFIKSWFWFQSSVQINTLKRKTIYISKLSMFSNHEFFQYDQFAKLPAYCYDGSQSSLQLQAPQQVEQKMQLKVLGIQLEQYELNSKGIPLFLDLVVSKLIMNNQALQQEGLFRINTGSKVNQQLEQILMNQQYQLIYDFEEPNALATYIKNFFHQLEVPLIPYSHYPMITSQSIPTFGSVSEIIESLPTLNKRVLTFLMSLLSMCLLFKEQNLMTSYNLAVVFGVSIIRPKEYTVEDMKKAVTIVAFTQLMLDNFKEVIIIFNPKLFKASTVEQFLSDQQEEGVQNVF